MIIDVGDIIVITYSGVHTYHRMVSKYPDGGGEFLTVQHDGTKHPQAREPSVITHEELTNPKGYYIDIYNRADNSHD